MKKTLALLLGALMAVPLAQAQVETGTSSGARALDQARSQPISAGSTQTENVTVAAGQVGSKEVVVVEEEEKWWSLNASTGWDSLYMFRGSNILGNGNGIYWLGAGLGIVPWENGSFDASFWYGFGSWWNGANQQTTYGEVDVTLSYTHSFGPLALTAGWIYYHFPNTEDAFERIPTNQNEIFFGAAYDIALGSVTLTPNLAYYYNIGPELGTTTGFANGGSSYLLLQLDANIPVAYDGAVALEPYTSFGFNFGFNNSVTDATVDPVAVQRFNGGNNWQLGVALPIQFTSWFGISPYIAYSYQWQNIQAFGTGQNVTDANTWWCGISANISY
jgi:hypothetical protein